MSRGIKLYDAIAEPVLVVLENLWHFALPIAIVVIVTAALILILRKRKKAREKKKDEE